MFKHRYRLMTSAAALLAIAPMIPLAKDAGPAPGADRFAGFFPFTKVDAKTRIVVGPVGIEVEDRSKEIMDYDTAKEAFQKFADEQTAASGGKNFGNLRVMHTKSAAGLFVEGYIFDDANKQILGKAHVVDDQAWALVEAGVLTGFSPGGGYAKRWPDPTNPLIKRYTPVIQEISLVDRPCIPGATFEFTKADGVAETRALGQQAGLVKIGDAEPQPIGLVEGKARELAKAAGKEGADDWHEYVTAAEAELLKKVVPIVQPPADIPPKVDPAAAAIASQQGKDGVLQKWVARDNTTHETKAAAIAHNAECDAKASVAETVKPLSDLLGKVSAALDRRAESGPMDGAALAAFAKTWKAGDDVPERFQQGFVALRTTPDDGPVSKVITEATQADGWPGLMAKLATVVIVPPTGEPEKLAKDAPPVVKVVTADEFAKDLSDVSRLAGLLSELNWLRQSVESETSREGDSSPIPAQLKTALASLCSVLRNMVVEETGELFVSTDAPMLVGILELAAGKVNYHHFDALMKVLGEANTELAKAAGENPLAKAWPLLEKVGARNSSADKKRIQGIHDAANELGADCMEKAAEAGELQKAVALNSELSKAVGDLTGKLGELLKRVETVEAMPAAPKGSVRSVDREGDGLPGVERPDMTKLAAQLEAMPEMERGLLLTKVAQRTPMRITG